MTERERARALQGRRAGFVSRIAAAAIDVSIVLAVYFAALIGYGLVRSIVTEKSFSVPTPPTWFSGTALIALLVVGLAILWSASGRTLGDSAVGLRVVTEQGARVSFARALGRAIVLVIVPFVSMGWILVSRKNAGLHDLASHTTVIYDWRPRHESPRVAEVPQPAAVPEPIESRQN